MSANGLAVDPADANVVYLATTSGVFKSTDAGESFTLVQGLWDHPHRPQWQPGAVVVETTQRPVLHPRLPSVQVHAGLAGLVEHHLDAVDQRPGLSGVPDRAYAEGAV